MTKTFATSRQLKKNHLDFAMRWVHTIGDFDIGASWFHGTNRDPILTQSDNNEKAELQQYYNQMDQLGVDIQAALGDWLWKFETIFRTTKEDDYWATQAGFEYTYVGFLNTNTDFRTTNGIQLGFKRRNNTQQNRWQLSKRPVFLEAELHLTTCKAVKC